MFYPFNRILLAIWLLLFANINSALATTDIEFYKADIDHYFMTADSNEATSLDNNTSWNWVRTGKIFNVWLTQDSAPSNASPVCRFFGVFANGNHRYMASQTEVNTMVAQGWGDEGVVMCSGMSVYKTSYENKNSISLDNPTTPPHWEVPGVQLESWEYGWGGRHIGFADFTQEGAYSAIVFVTSYKNVYPGSNSLKWPDSPSKIYFLRKDTATGKWNDVTSSLIKNANERYVCITPSFVEIADLNNDQKPDVFISCTGGDFQINGQFTDVEYSDQFIVLSQTDGSYKVSKLPIGEIYGHQAALADINNDGNVDILTVDPYVNKTPFILWGKGDGTFQQDLTRFPSDMYAKNIYGIHAIPINGKINVFVSADAPGSYSNPADGEILGYGLKVLQYKNGYFQYVQDLTNGIPRATSTGLQYGLALDVIYHQGSYYTYQVTTDYTNEAIIKINPNTGVGTILAENFRQGKGGTNIYKITSQNAIVGQLSGCSQNSKNPDDWYYNICNFKLQLE